MTIASMHRPPIPTPCSLGWGKVSLRSLWVATVAWVVAGCATTPAPPPEHTIRLMVPEVSPLPETDELQRRGGVAVTVAPATVTVESAQRCEYSPTSGLLAFLNRPSGASSDTHKPLEVRRFPTQRLVGGDELRFVVTITNHMERVFRGSGALVQFNVDGRVQGTEQEQYEDLLTALIPPGEERQYVIGGLPVDLLPGESTLALDLYDLITEIDAAGNVTRRDNFQWYFRVTMDRRVETVTGTRDYAWLPNHEADQLVAAQDRGIHRCHDVAPTTVEDNPISQQPSFTPFTVGPEVRNRARVRQVIEREYPTTLRDAGIRGAVLMHFFINERGVVETYRVAESSGYPQLDQAALRVAPEFEFTPALNRDTPVPVWIQWPIQFSDDGWRHS